MSCQNRPVPPYSSTCAVKAKRGSSASADPVCRLCAVTQLDAPHELFQPGSGGRHDRSVPACSHNWSERRAMYANAYAVCTLCSKWTHPRCSVRQITHLATWLFWPKSEGLQPWTLAHEVPWTWRWTWASNEISNEDGYRWTRGAQMLGMAICGLSSYLILRYAQ